MSADKRWAGDGFVIRTMGDLREAIDTTDGIPNRTPVRFSRSFATMKGPFLVVGPVKKEHSKQETAYRIASRIGGQRCQIKTMS